MNTDNVWIVVLLLLGIVVLSNLFMFALVRGSKGMKFDRFKDTGDTLSQPFKKANDELGELRQRVGNLENSDNDSPEMNKDFLDKKQETFISAHLCPKGYLWCILSNKTFTRFIQPRDNEFSIF